jgi:cell pole-organizing protein PopZ
MEEILASIRRLIAEDEAELGGAGLSDERRSALARGARAWAAAPAAQELLPSPAARCDQEPSESVTRSSSASGEGAQPIGLSQPGREAARRSPDSSPDALSEAEEEPASQEPFDDGSEPDSATPEEAVVAEHGLAPSEAFAPQEYEVALDLAEVDAPESGAPLVSATAAASITAQFQALAASKVLNDSGLLHEYAREMLRPMLRAWLDDNLPVLVERLVRAEIERVARGGRP